MSQELLGSQRGLLNAVRQLGVVGVGIEVGQCETGLYLVDDFLLALFVCFLLVFYSCFVDGQA
jgi:hypothetical protein